MCDFRNGQSKKGPLARSKDPKRTVFLERPFLRIQRRRLAMSDATSPVLIKEPAAGEASGEEEEPASPPKGPRRATSRQAAAE